MKRLETNEELIYRIEKMQAAVDVGAPDILFPLMEKLARKDGVNVFIPLIESWFLNDPIAGIMPTKTFLEKSNEERIETFAFVSNKSFLFNNDKKMSGPVLEKVTNKDDIPLIGDAEFNVYRILMTMSNKPFFIFFLYDVDIYIGPLDYFESFFNIKLEDYVAKSKEFYKEEGYLKPFFEIIENKKENVTRS